MVKRRSLGSGWTASVLPKQDPSALLRRWPMLASMHRHTHRCSAASLTDVPSMPLAEGVDTTTVQRLPQPQPLSRPRPSCTRVALLRVPGTLNCNRPCERSRRSADNELLKIRANVCTAASDTSNKICMDGGLSWDSPRRFKPDAADFACRTLGKQSAHAQDLSSTL